MSVGSKSIKTTVGGYVTIGAGILALVYSIIVNKGTIDPAAIGVATVAITTGITLLNAKDNDVSNSPVPLSVAQKVVVAGVSAVEPIMEVVDDLESQKNKKVN